MRLPRRNRKIRDTLNNQLIPNSLEISALVELDFIRNSSRAISFVGSVLKVPPRLTSLYERPHDTSLALIACILVDCAPHFQVLRCVAVCVLRVTLPRDKVCSKGRKSELVDIVCGKDRDNVADGGISYRNPEIIASEREH